MSAVPLFIGIDVAKAQLDVALRPTGERWAVVNADTSIAALVARLQADIQAHITWLNTRLAALDDDLDTMLRASPVWRGANSCSAASLGLARSVRARCCSTCQSWVC